VLRPLYAALPPGGAPRAGLPARVALLYRDRLATAPAADSGAVREVVDHAVDPADRYLRRAFAAGNDVATVRRLAATWAAWGPEQVRHAIGRFDDPAPGDTGLTRSVSCGAAVVVAARMMADPAYAHHVAVSPPAVFGAAQARVQRAANVFWPRGYGMTPWGVAATMNVHSGMYGARYRAEPVDPADPPRVAEALGAVAADVTAGWPVPLLAGAGEPGHWMLAVAAHDGTLTCYDPLEAGITVLPVDELEPLALVYPVRHA
jgi:hypothetical protein